MSGSRLEKERKVQVLTPGSPGSPGDPGQPYIAGHWEIRYRWVTWGNWGYSPQPPGWEDHWESYRVWIPPQPYIPPTPGVPPTPPVLEEDFQLGWNAGAYSIEAPDGNVAFSFTLDTGNVGIVVGLTVPDAVAGESYVGIRYGFFIEREQARVIESGEFRTGFVTFAPGAVFTVKRVGRNVSYWIDGELLAASARPATEPALQADCALYSGLDAINDAAFSVPTGVGIGEGSLQPLTGSGRALPLPAVAEGVLPWLTGHGGQRLGVAAEGSLSALTGWGAQGEPVFGHGSFAPLTGTARAVVGARAEGRLSPLRVIVVPGAGNRPGTVEGRGSLRALTGLAKGGGAAVWGLAALSALTGDGQAVQPIVPAVGSARLRPLTGVAGTALNAARGAGALAALTAIGFADALDEPVIGAGSLLPLSGRASAVPGARAVSALRPLTGFAAEDAAVVIAAGALLPLEGHARSGLDGRGFAALSPLTGVGWGPTAQGRIAQGFGALLPLQGTARAPLPEVGAIGTAVLEPLQGFALQMVQGAVTSGQRFRPLTGRATIKAGTRGYGDGALAPLTGHAADQPYVQGRGALKALTGQGLGGLIQPRKPTWGWAVLMPLTAAVRAPVARIGRGAGTLQPLRGKGGQPYTWGEGTLQPLQGQAWAAPDIFCQRYIPRLWLRALGIRQGFRYGLPITCDAALTATPEPLRLRCDARLAARGTLWAAATAGIARVQRPMLSADAAVAKPRTRKSRANAWVLRPQNVTASMDAELEA